MNNGGFHSLVAVSGKTQQTNDIYGNEVCHSYGFYNRNHFDQN